MVVFKKKGFVCAIFCIDKALTFISGFVCNDDDLAGAVFCA